MFVLENLSRFSERPIANRLIDIMPSHHYQFGSVSLKEVLRGLRDIFSENKVDVDEVKSLLRAYQSDPKDWQKYCTFDPSRYFDLFISVCYIIPSARSHIANRLKCMETSETTQASLGRFHNILSLSLSSG